MSDFDRNRSAVILDSARSGRRISEEDAVTLYNSADLNNLGQAADRVKKHHHRENRVTFIIDRNINYTNICINECSFCAFYRPKDSPEAYLLCVSEILDKVKEAVSLGGSQIMLQGGLHPDLEIDYYTQIFKAIKDNYDVVIHSLSPPEIVHITKMSGLSIIETLDRLKEAGLDSLPGGGAEILSDSTRKRISPKKIMSGEWLYVMRAAHSIGMHSTATMMFGVGEDIKERVHHLSQIRALQNETGMFRAFIPWSYMPGNTELGGDKASAEEYLRMVAISRLFLDNISNIQGSWLTQGSDVGQMSLLFGANDLGSTMLEENVVRSTGVTHTMDVDKIVELIKKSGLKPALRDTEYNVIKEFS